VLHGLYISQPLGGRIFVAERSRKGSTKLLWSVMPQGSFATDVRIEARAVPYHIRRQAYRWLGKESS